jgi:hypothetical protein
MGTGIPQDWKERASLGGYAIPGRATIRAPIISAFADSSSDGTDGTGWTGTPARAGKPGRGSKK